MKPWREIAVPHADVLKGTFQQAEFAADITAVHAGKAPREYQDAAAFFERTYITEGMRLLLTQVAQRLAGKGGEPVIQLQTAFGGGKTHTMLAVLHLASRTVPLSDLPGIPSLIERAGLLDLPRAKVAVLDGTAHAPGQPWKRGRTSIKTLWGELAWQLGGTEGLARVKESDASGTSPGKDVLAELLAEYAPCVVLVDELVAYIRQFPEGQVLSGGTFESNISFIQSLTEAVKLVPTAVALASLPDSRPQEREANVQVGGSRGILALGALESVFGRVQALWRTAAIEESFEIIRRRLFEPIRDVKTRDEVCRAFTDLYIAEGTKLPSETQEGRYLDRLKQAYPIHPEVFDRLYGDWTTIDGFQRTRGVLKLMAKVIFRLWQDSNQDLMILPASLPLHHGDVRNEMTYLLASGWDPVIEGDIDGPRAETTSLENREPRLGQVQAARRVARTLFLGTAPASVAIRQGIRGLDRGRVLLGCVQPGQTSAVYADALNRLVDRLHYLNSSGDKAADATRYWFDTRANLRREMEDRKGRFDDRTDVREKIAEVTKKLFTNVGLFDGVHVFTPHGDVPDDSALRLVVLGLDAWHSKDSGAFAGDAVRDYLRSHGNQPRHRANRLLFVAPDQPVIGRLKEATRVALAWASIVEDVDEGRLNIDQNQRVQAEREARSAAEVLPRVARETFRWLLCPTQDDPAATQSTVEAFPLNTSSSQVGGEIDRVCQDNELIIGRWSPIHLRTLLKAHYWKHGRTSIPLATVWDDSLKYVYLPRLKTREVLTEAVRAGTTSRDFFGTAHGENGDRFDGFQFGTGDGTASDTLLLIEPETALKVAIAEKKVVLVKPSEAGATVASDPVENGQVGGSDTVVTTTNRTPQTVKLTSFHGSVTVPAATAKMKMLQVIEEVVNLLLNDPNADVTLTLEIAAEFPQGVADAIRRAVSENANSLGFKTKDWE